MASGGSSLRNEEPFFFAISYIHAHAHARDHANVATWSMQIWLHGPCETY